MHLRKVSVVRIGDEFENSEFINNIDCCFTFYIWLQYASSKEKNKVGDTSRHSVFNLDAETIKNLEKGIIKGTPLRLDNDIKMSDVERIWGKPNEHFDHEDIQTYGYTIENQNFIIDEDEMKEIYTIQVELDYSKDEILEIMGKPTKPGNIFIYEKENYIIQFEKFNNKWRLILRKK